MMNGNLVIVFSLIGISVTSAQFLQDGQCDPEIVLQANFNADQFTGNWYKIGKSEERNVNNDGTCPILDITRTDNTNFVFAYSGILKDIRESQNVQTTLETGTAKFTLLNYGENGASEDFWILGTNYVSYAIAYKCENVGTTQRNLFITLLGRETTIDPIFDNFINNIVSPVGVSVEDLISTDYSEEACFALPPYVPGQAVVLPGQCDPNISLLTTFNTADFLGTWYEIYSYYSANALGTCATAQYGLSDNLVTVLNSQVVNQTLDTITGTASIVEGATGQLLVLLEVFPGVFVDSYLWVIDTDYLNYAISYSCINLTNDTKQVTSWIVSRDRQLSATAQTAVNQVVDSILDLNFAYYEVTDQTPDGCFYYPEFQEDTVVVFPGECDLSIPAVAGFDPTRYTGLWHDIESYPTSFQAGTCNNAYYTLVDGVVDVFNTQVINQTLDTITGEARLVSDDGSAKLAVTFPIEGTNFTITTSYWVLATDYENYSLVYTCEYNSLNNNRQVFSWKLSRTKSLTVSANAAMDAVIAGIPVLDDRYYVERDQSPEGCFYYPEPEEGVPVVFPGFCDENITAVQNFNLNSFQGSWFEIETYPKDQAGQCVQHQYTPAGTNALNVASIFVEDQFLSSSSGVLTYSSTDNSGKFNIRINVGNNQEIEIPFWILATDYNSYALAYSCMEREGDNDYRAVYAWKLSRNQQGLSAAADTAINAAMENVDVLDQKYFETVDQTEEGCLSLPIIPAGEPIIIDGQCDPNVEVVQNFSAGDYVGLWHLVESYWSEFQNGNCNDATYTAQADGSVLVFNTQVINQTIDTITGSAVVISTDGSAKLSVTFPDAPFPVEYWVIDTDYTSYALVYSCINLTNNTQQIWSWKMSRTKSLTETAINNINAAINNVHVLNNRYYYTIDNSDEACFYFPEANGQPVVFRGQCDESIPVVTNFNAVGYMGLWYDIESYPQLFQDGTCATAFYTLNEVVDVFNTQVINQRLDTITGSAVPLDSADGEAKLNVTFPIEVAPNVFIDVYSPYWVLATDYTDYALVYSCQNTGEDQRSVAGWKLSRTKALSAQAQTNINNVIASIDVLRQDYFEVKGHTDEDCFYYPEPTGEPVVFRGQCDETIQALPNFDLTRFVGEWNEIETYPKDQVGGQCIHHSFTASATSNTTLLLTSNQVFNSETLVSNSGDIVLSSTDGSGRFVLTINVNNQVIEIPYWIIDTDYTDYALVYSCMNRDEETRAVYSWKLSRSKELSNNANNLITAAMTSVDVLDQQYYEQVSHTDDSCFYLPETGPNEPTIFPGQCDPNIPVVQNFSAGDYLGLWHLIETYYSEFQDGNCNDAEYSLQADGSVLVYNTQVVNQTLDTITGRAEVIGTDGSAKLLVTFPDAPFPIEYWVVDTDYTTFALIYSCFNLENNRQQVWSWKMSRTRSLSAEAANRINEKIEDIRVLNNRYYGVVDNSDTGCFYFPEPNGQPVTFRGQCDETIPVVTNFNAVAYMGLWYDIESYPQLFQDGTCATAFYTLNEVVDVFNTQVINQRLDTITGSAVPLDSDNGEAKLNVTFPIEVAPNVFIDVYSPYWVLATDYTDYALVYSCQNTGEDQRSVASWKLSRTRALSAQAQTNINNVIASIDVLRQDYFEVKGHTDEDCFYYPEPTGEPVVFRGQCDETIQALPNFDLPRFAGEWNEIETYPKDQVGGQCIHHSFTASATSNTTLLLTSNQVFNSETLVSNSGDIVLSSTDGSGRFVLTINVNNQAIEIPYWIIDTDYSDYALVYSCMNRDAETRAVYSWKLSRSKELSNNANNLIASAMTSVDVLDQQYYEQVSHTDDSCFYLPETGPNEPAIFPGQCDPNIPVVQNFSAGDYLGLWHLIETYWILEDRYCNDAEYSLQADGSVLVYNTQVINQTLDTITGRAELIDTDGSAKLIVTFPDEQFPTEYWIVDTDYTTFALIYTCFNLENNRQLVQSWKMSRTRSLTAEATNRINEKIEDIRVLNNRYYGVVDNSDAACFYFPEPNGQPVTFRGQCDETIPVVTNFNAVAYMGLWYDIESYPQLFQEGTCATAFYTLNEVVDVFNTQVIDQRLDTITGSAVPLDSDNGEAKLNVTFPIEVAPNVFIDVFSPYWVLATDYTDYALVYSCQNTGEDQRSVASWKLSRTRALSAQAQTNINNVISSIDVLRQDYFEVKGHTDEDCFYYPEPNGEPVVFRGQCDETIQALPNFDLERFSGTWNEIETYPKEQAGGQCISHEFSTSTTSNITLQLISNQVFNSETLVSNNGELVLVSTDGSGRFSLTINVGNQPFTIPYWVIDTDYTDYALIYSCMNRNAETRAVYSWKLSRSSELSTNANTAINTAMTTIDILEQEYYEPISQTPASCFYLPSEINPNEPAIFTGQCDTTIPVVQNFDASRFSDRWFDIESYFDDYTGTCTDGTFTQSGNGYSVTFTQVLNQTLDVTTSTATLSSDNSGKLLVTSNGVQYEYWILDTDYDSWALLYSCENINANQRRVRSWKMSRTRQLTAEANTAINAIISSTNVLNQLFYRTRDHSEAACFYYPTPDGNPVRFRGRCDQNINVVQNFNVADYLGQWYDIQSYPQTFQDGECATALYTLGADGVDVYNTQVVNQQLDEIYGLAVVASTDNSAKLSVTFEVNGLLVESPYWVLATDYTSYSLVYSCSEIDDEYKQVSAWKLSRTQSLTVTAEQQINQAMNSIPVLQQEYFREIGHSEEDCFYYPDNNGGPVILDGQCPSPDEIEAVNNFNLNSFTGTWHEVSRFPSEIQTGECASGEYSLSTANSISITQNIVNNERLVVATGSGSASTDGRGIITASFTSDQSTSEFDMYILDTDYNEFALLYACKNVNDAQKQIYSWKLSRSRTGFSQAANDRISAIVSNNIDLFELYYDVTAQTDAACFYYPEFDVLPAVIELPGPCNETIRGIAGFNAEAYLGRWFEMARYPQPFQFGACDQATYSLGNGVVDVYNTQVVNRSLLTQEGFAEVASTDGTGQLQVTFEVEGFTNIANYYIMATDYTSYALVYSCRDLNNGNREVSSWKLSRDRTLNNAANQAMDVVIANTQGLLQDYYVPTSQNLEDCFYVPEPNPDQYVAFRGQCEDISGVQNFNIQNYFGLWHEVERYPTGQNDGVCISADFSGSGGQYQVVDTNVFDLSADIGTSTVTVTTNGRIRRTSGQTTTDVWVLATDYDSYALLYSCEEIDDEYRRVWSAKHSRSRSLSATAEAAINEVLTTNNLDLLYQQHYVTVDQTDEACFYYPQVTGGPVVLPGQCDPDIPVQQNFALEEYTGTWYQIERYPQMWETGDCTGARYTINEETGVVDVINWEVIDGVLDTIEGTASPTTDDGSAKFVVELPSRAEGAEEGDTVQMDLYVLKTDYVSYSLVYSCVNINQYQRQLGVWKLSRTRQLLSTDETEINSYMASREELDQRYFISVDQNEDCAEPDSGYLIQSSIILLLVCSILQFVM